MFLRSEPEHYDMILMDVQMPVMNGHLWKRATGLPRPGSQALTDFEASGRRQRRVQSISKAVRAIGSVPGLVIML